MQLACDAMIGTTLLAAAIGLLPGAAPSYAQAAERRWEVDYGDRRWSALTIQMGLGTRIALADALFLRAEARGRARVDPWYYLAAEATIGLGARF